MKYPEIKMVVTDLDGTLLSPERTISDMAVQTIQRLQQRGVLFTFITGRPPYAVERFAARVHPTAPLVCCNGAIIVREGVVVHKQSFLLEPLLPLLRHAAELGLTVLVYADGTEYTLTHTAWTAEREAHGRPFPLLTAAVLAKSQAEKVNIMADGNEAVFLTLVEALRGLDGRYTVACYGSTGCELVAKEVNKGTGLLELCRLTGIAPGEVLAIGDNENDHPMLRLAGVGAAVANATPQAKAIADYQCTQSCTDGVVEAICRYVFEEAVT